MPRLELIVERTGERVLLKSPEVGIFTRALEKGRLLSPGAGAGVIRSLERAFDLVVPADTAGRIVSARPERVNEPVGYGTVLYELAPLESLAATDTETRTETATVDGALLFRAPHSGRFWHRPSPQDPPFVKAGDVVDAGHAIGLLEVMKTFTHLDYRPGTELPVRARVKAMCVEDGAEVSEGDPLIEVEPIR